MMCQKANISVRMKFRWSGSYTLQTSITTRRLSLVNKSLTNIITSAISRMFKRKGLKARHLIDISRPYLYEGKTKWLRYPYYFSHKNHPSASSFAMCYKIKQKTLCRIERSKCCIFAGIYKYGLCVE